MTPAWMDFDRAAQTGFGTALIAHLGGEFLLVGQAADGASFIHGLDEGFLAKTVLAHLHGADGRDTMMVVRSGDGHRIDILPHFLEQLAVVLEFFDVRELLGELTGFLVQRGGIHVADRHDITTTLGGIGTVTVAFAAYADARDIDALIGAQHTAHVRKGERHCPGRNGGAAEKLAASKSMGFYHRFQALLLHVEAKICVMLP